MQVSRRLLLSSFCLFLESALKRIGNNNKKYYFRNAWAFMAWIIKNEAKAVTYRPHPYHMYKLLTRHLRHIPKCMKTKKKNFSKVRLDDMNFFSLFSKQVFDDMNSRVINNGPLHIKVLNMKSILIIETTDIFCTNGSGLF